MERIQMESLLQFDKDPPELLDTDYKHHQYLQFQPKPSNIFFKGLLKIHCVSKQNAVIPSCVVWDFIIQFASLMHTQPCLFKLEYK